MVIFIVYNETCSDTFNLHSGLKSDLLLISCDLVTTLPLHMLADMHRTTGASVTMLLAPMPDLVKSSAPGSKTSKKQGETFNISDYSSYLEAMTIIGICHYCNFT